LVVELFLDLGHQGLGVQTAATQLGADRFEGHRLDHIRVCVQLKKEPMQRPELRWLLDRHLPPYLSS
jgi:hypothetical protein